MRMIILTLLFFFGPAILMFALHRVAMMIHFWWLMRQRGKQQQPEIINITPVPERPHVRPGLLFIVASMVVASVCAVLAWQSMQDGAPGRQGEYVPAHLDSEGRFVPGTTQPDAPAGQNGMRHKE